MFVVCGNVVLNCDEVRFIKPTKLKDGKWTIVAWLKNEEEPLYCVEPNEDKDLIKLIMNDLKTRVSIINEQF